MIEIANLSCRFGAVSALDHVSMSLQGGRCHALLGSNGAGKTTLLRTLAGIVEPTAGHVHVDGEDVAGYIGASRAFYLPEQFKPPAWMRGHEFLDTMRRVVGLDEDEALLHASLAVLDFDVAALARPMSSYSKGMTQKLGLLCALHCGRPLLLLDEPMSGLDPRARIGLARLLTERARSGATIVCSLHSLSEAMNVAQRLWIFARGELRFEGTAVDLAAKVRPPNALNAYLRVTGHDADAPADPYPDYAPWGPYGCHDTESPN